MNVTWDCMWWMRVLPISVNSTRVTLGFCFPKSTVQLLYFPDVLERYRARWDTAVMEDNAISLNQQAGLRSSHRRQGRFTPLEFGTHSFNNWLLDHVLQDGLSWDPGKRQFNISYSNDDPTFMEHARLLEQSIAGPKL